MCEYNLNHLWEPKPHIVGIIHNWMSQHNLHIQTSLQLYNQYSILETFGRGLCQWIINNWHRQRVEQT